MSTPETPSNVQTCPVCQVKIRPQLGGDRVVYAFGPEGTRPDLWTKICRHVQQAGCINEGGGKKG
jgi:hypothetical protein